jgi:hypothetical protein
VNAVWNIAPGFFIVPEIGVAEYDYAGDPGEASFKMRPPCSTPVPNGRSTSNLSDSIA